MRINDLFEARKPAPLAPVDFNSVLVSLKGVAEKLVARPFDLDWDYTYGQAIKKRVEAAKKQHADAHDPEFDGQFTPLDDRDLYIEFLPDLWRQLQTRTFSAARNEIEHDILAYQKRHGERLDREAGHAHDMHYIEDSDWLRAMDVQKRVGETVAHSSVVRPHDLQSMVAEIEAFVGEWPSIVQTDQRDEPALVEAMVQGLSAAIPLLMLVAKKSA